jgi:hypothetical protein
MAEVILNRHATGDSETSQRPALDADEPSSSRFRRELPIWKKLVFATITTLLAILLVAVAAEFLLRIRHGRLTDASKIIPDVAYVVSMLPTIYDPELGYVPRPRATNYGPDRVNVDDEGLRRNGNFAPSPGPPILAVGDSYTWGSQVSDDETWPARLEQMLDRRVLNAGVNGYGVDQIVMRAERLVPNYRPAALVVAIIGDDIKRCAFAYRYLRWRPYYTVEGNSLRLHNVPIPRESPPPPPKSAFRDLLRRSDLADSLLKRLAPEWWSLDEGTLQVHRDFVNVAILLMDRLGNLQRRSGVPVLLVVEHAAEFEAPSVQRVVARARSQGLQALDLSEPVRVLSDRTKGTPEAFARGHFTARGNRWVADRIAEKLGEMGVVRAPQPKRVSESRVAHEFAYSLP